MTASKLKPALRSLVREHGLGKVLKSLGEIAEARRKGDVKQVSRRSSSLTAPEYVEKLNLPAKKLATVIELANRFQQKEFLPNFRSVAEFCRTYHIEVPASKGRASAIPRVFKFISNMEDGEVERILDNGMFSGPSRLGPIADAIRNFSRMPTLTRSE